QWKRNRVAFQLKDEDVPVYPTIASQFNDPGVTWMFANLCRLLREKGKAEFEPKVDTALREPRATVLIPGNRTRYLAEIAEAGRQANASIEKQAEAAERAQHYYESLRELGDPNLPKPLELFDPHHLVVPTPSQAAGSEAKFPECGERRQGLPDRRKMVFQWERRQGAASG